MNKLVAGLAVSTIACGATALYYRQQLLEERAKAVPQVNTSVPVEPRTVASAAPTAPTPAPAATSAPPPKPAAHPAPPAAKPASGIDASSAEAPPENLTADRRARLKPLIEEYLRRYDDPAQRSALRDQALARVRQSLDGYAKDHNIDSATYEKLVDLLADQEIERRAVEGRCILDPQCSVSQNFKEISASQRQAVSDLIGADAAKSVADYRAAAMDRRAIGMLASRVDAQLPLSSDQASALISMHRSEQRSAMIAFSMSGQRFTGYTNQDGMTVLYANQGLSMAEQMASAQSYSQHMRDQAATLISGPQLVAYNQMQDDLLHDLERKLQRDAARSSQTSVERP